MGPGARSKFGIPLKSFGSKYTPLRKVVTLMGLFHAPHSDSAPGKLPPPCPPRYAPVCEDKEPHKVVEMSTWYKI